MFLFPPFALPLGGLYGRNWLAAAAASRNTAEKPDPANVGAQAARSRANAIKSGAIKDAGIRAGEIIGWRAWQVSDNALFSMVVNTPWLPGEPLHSNEVYDRFGGIHAFKTRAQAIKEYGWWAFADNQIAIGQVALWGEVIEHSGGYRAEYGAVHRIDRVLGRRFRRWFFFWRPNPAIALNEKYCAQTTD